jgi:hypothetical protein
MSSNNYWTKDMASNRYRIQRTKKHSPGAACAYLTLYESEPPETGSSTEPPHFLFQTAKLAESLRKTMSERAPRGIIVGAAIAATSRGLAVELFSGCENSNDMYSVASLMDGHAHHLSREVELLAANATRSEPQGVDEIIGNEKEIALLTVLAHCEDAGVRPTYTSADGTEQEFPKPELSHLNIVAATPTEPLSLNGLISGIRKRGERVQIEVASRYWIDYAVSVEEACALLVNSTHVKGRVHRKIGSDDWMIVDGDIHVHCQPSLELS